MELRYTGFTFLALFITIATAGPINFDLFKDSRTCAKRCIDNHKFDYKVGNVYVYEYEAESTTGIVGASEDSASVRIKANVEIEPTSSCDFEMRLTEASLEDPYQREDARFSSSEFSEILTQWPLRFSFQDGRIEDLCPTIEEPLWSLNIKRGILSSFQNSMTRLDQDQTITEVDITGSCVTKYNLSESDSDTVIKTKDFVSCKHRQGIHSSVQSIGYDVKSDIQCLAIMKSSYVCKQRFNKREEILEESRCTEKHIFRPFSNGDNGASTVNTQTLRFVRNKRGGVAQQDEIEYRSDLLFVHQSGSAESLRKAEDKIKEKLEELCQIFREDVRPEQPQHFTELIQNLRRADSQSLKKIYKEINGGRICRENPEKIKKMFFDALPMVGTSGSLSLMQNLIWKREVDVLQKNMWLASLPFIQNPDKEMISAVKPLIEEPEVEGNTILLISSLVSGYCSVNPKCGDVDEVKDIIQSLERMLGRCSSDGPYEKALYALRALGNIGHSKSIVPRLTQCFTRRENPIQLRLAAIDAYRRIPCDVMRVDLLDLFNNIDEDSELRINAYLALMKCPHKNLIMRMKEALMNEKTNQVGSFVWTHLTNLRETSDPHLQDVRAILEDEELKREFNKDKRKFSRNYEGSFFLDQINVGGKVDSNVIFSPKSFVPRSANLNLTVDLFGRAINFFEFGTRMEGVEQFFERYFGSNGYFKSKKGTQKSQANRMGPIDDKYKVDIDSMKGFAYVRMFGNELGFWQFEEPNLSFFKNFDIRKWVDEEKISFSKNMALMDTRLIVPTILGLPLNLTVTATTSVNAELKGKVNFASFKNIEIEGHLKPSGAVEVVSEMTVDAFVTKAGLRMNSLAHSSTEMKMNFKMKNSKLIESRFEFPKKRMEIITYKSDFSIIKGDMTKKQKMIEDNRVKKDKCTGESFNKVTGLKLCTEIQFSNASMKREAPYFPFTGPVLMHVELLNQDIPEGYYMKASINEAAKSVIMIDTPDSRTDRKISLEIDVSKPEKNIEFDSPWKKLTFLGKFIKNRSTKLLSGEIILDHKNSKVNKYSATFQMDYSSAKGEMKWTPKIVIMSPSKKMVLDGTIVNSGKQIEADLKAVGFLKEEISLKMSTIQSKREYSCITTLRYGPKEYFMKAKVGIVPKGKAVTYSPEFQLVIEGKELAKFESSLLYNPDAKIIFNFKLDKVFSKIVAANTRILISNNKYRIKNILHFNLKGPKVNLDVRGSLELKELRFATRVVTTYNIGKYQDKLTISGKLLDHSSKRFALYNGDVAVESKKNPKQNFIVKGQVGMAEKHYETKWVLIVGNGKKGSDQFFFDTTVNYNFTPDIKDINYTISFRRPKKEWDVLLKLNHMNTKLFPGGKIESGVELNYETHKRFGVRLQFEMKNKENFEGFISARHLHKEVFRLEEKLSSVRSEIYNNHLSILVPGGKRATLQSDFKSLSDNRKFSMDHTLRLPNNREVKLKGIMGMVQDKGYLHLEMDADRATVRQEPWNPKLAFDYYVNMHRQKLNTLSTTLVLKISPNEEIRGTYSFSSMKDDVVNQNLRITTPFKNLNIFEMKYTHKKYTNEEYQNILIYINDYYNYMAESTVRFDGRDFYYDYKLTEKIYDEHHLYHINMVSNRQTTSGMIKYKLNDDSMEIELKVDHLPNKLDVKLTSDMTFPKNGFDFHLKSVSMASEDEDSFNSDGELKLKHPKIDLELTYFAQADRSRIAFDTNFVCPTSRHKNGKMALDIAMDEERTSYMGKFDIDYNSRPLYSLNTGYKYENGAYDFQFAFLLPNGERVTTVVKFSRDSNLHAEIKLPTALKSFELDMDGNVECQGRKCDYKLQLTTNSHYFRSLNVDMKYMEASKIDLKSQFSGFRKNMELNAKLDGEDWSGKTISADFKFDGREQFKVEGNYQFESPRMFDVKFTATSKVDRYEGMFDFTLHRKVMRSNKGDFELSGKLGVYGEKYEVSFKGKNFKEIKAKLETPNLDYEATLTMDKLMLDDFDVGLNIRLNSDEHRFSIFNRRFLEMKFSASLASFEDFNIVYNGGIDDQKRGSFRFRISYGEYYIESNSTVNMNNQFELKSAVDFKVYARMARNPRVHTGSGEIKFNHHFDAIFQKIAGTFTFNKEKINFSSLVKNTGKINLSMRLKTTFNFNANLKAQIKPDNMYNTDLSLNFDTKWTGSKKLTYSHSGQRGKTLEIKADLGDGKGKNNEYTLSARVSMRNEYDLTLELTTDNMANKYVFDGELMLGQPVVKGKLRLEAPFRFMDGKPLEISFNKEPSKFDSRGSFRAMEYNTDVEFTRQSFMVKAYVNWNKQDRASNFNFIMNFDTGMDASTDKKFQLKLIHPVRTVSFGVKYLNTGRMMDANIEFSPDADKGQKFALAFGHTRDAGFVMFVLPERTFKISGRVYHQNGKQSMDGSFFWNFNKDDSKKVDFFTSVFPESQSTTFDVTVKFPSQSKGMRLKHEISWHKGDTLFKSKSEFSFDQDPSKTFVAQMQLLKDDNNKYTLTLSLLHPAIDLKLLTTFRIFELNNKLTASMDVRHNMKDYNVVAYLDKNKNEIGLQASAPEYTAEASAHYLMDGDYEIAAKMQEYSANPMEAYINLSPSRKNLKVQIDYDKNMPEKSYRIDANLMTNKIVMLEAFRMDDDDTMRDVKMDFKLDEANILHGKIVWKPSLIYEFNEYAYRTTMQSLQILEKTVEQWAYEAAGELSVMGNSFAKAHRREIREIVDYLREEYEEIHAEFRDAFQNVMEMYERNYLNMKSIVQGMVGLFYEVEYRISRAFSYFEYHFRERFMNFYRAFKEDLEKAKFRLNEIYQESYMKLAYDLDQAKMYVMEKLMMWNKQWEMKRDEYLQKLNELNRRTYQKVYNHRYTKAFLMAINHQWPELVDFMRSQDMMIPLADLIDYVQMNMENIEERFENFMDELRTHPAMQDIFSMINELYQQLVWAYKYWEVEETIRNLDDRVKNYITSTANRFRYQVFSMNHLEMITFDIRLGEIEFKVPFVLPMILIENQEEIDRFHKMVRHTVNKFNEWKPDYYFSLPDLYYSMKPSSNPLDWIPPFKAQAYILRGQHIKTFDGVHLDFKGSCSYVLTRDFVDNNLTVVANYGSTNNGRGIESVLFQAGSERVQLFHDYMVRHNDDEKDLPIRLHYFSVNRIGNKMEVRSKLGFTVTFNPTQGSVIVDISGWYFGKVAGLFGTYNNEQFDDMIIRNGEQADTTNEFAFNWALPGCRSRRNFAEFERDNHQCQKWFTGYPSPFSNCFRQIEPASFYKACNTVHRPEEDVCVVAMFYVDRCAEKGVPLEMPEECLMCKTKGGHSFVPGTEVTFDHESGRDEIENSADIVLVVEQKKCNQRSVTELSRTIRRIENILVQKGTNDNRFGLVGFGGDNIHPEYAMTIQSKLMVSPGLMMNHIRNLEFYDGLPTTDPLKAISLATQYPFRPTVRKAIVLVSCDMRCEKRTVSYDKVLKQLEQNDISLHLLQKYQFEILGNKSPKADLYGLDRKGVFTRTKDPMFDTVKVPRSNCADLALASYGSMFDANKMIQRDNTAFVNTFIERLVESLKMVDCQQCQCGLNEMGMTQSFCSRCPSEIQSYTPRFYQRRDEFYLTDFGIGQEIKEQLNEYWELFKKDTDDQSKPANKKNSRGKRRRRR